MDFRELARLLRARDIMDVEDASTYLGMQKSSLEAAAYKKRIGYVQIGMKKLFTREDLDDYRERAAKGRFSQLTYIEPEVIPRLDPEELAQVG